MSVLRAPGMVMGNMLRAAFTNERLFLMGLTSLALSLASGWTTFEGMTNFTKSPVLCFLITFGVQGIMLVSAWMIGEALIALRVKREGREQQNTAKKIFNTVFDGPATIFKIWLIWMVFLFSMAISVFFSFDSLFSSIFSNEERERAGEIRAQSEVGTVLAELKSRIEKRKFEAQDTLLASEAWGNYRQRLDALSKVARSAPELVEQQLISKLRNEQTEIARHQESFAQAKGQRAALETRQQKIATDINRLKADRPGLSAEVDELRQQLRAKQRLIDQSKAEAMEEARGIGATGREGEGPKFRAIKEKQKRLTAERDVITTQKELAESRLEKLDGQIATLSRELELVNGEIAKIDGQASVAKTFIDAQAKRQTETAAREFSATASIDSLDDARERFRTQPGQDTFLSIQTNCTNLYSALSEVPKIAPEIKTISCEPGADTATLAARIFTLQAAHEAQEKKCVIGRTKRSTRIDSLLKLGKRCIQTSGLEEKDANELRTILNRVDLNRDDKAKNFVVTLNAFKDGNWLAYLALGLAIAIDSLVFISGLIGAKTASYDNTGNPGDIMRYGLGMSSDITGNEPEDIFTAKLFFRSVDGPSYLPGYLAVIDRGRLRPEERTHVNKVLTIAGNKVVQDKEKGKEEFFHVEETFYQNLARQVYLWDKFNQKDKKRNHGVYKFKQRNHGANDNEHETTEGGEWFFGRHATGGVTKTGERRISWGNERRAQITNYQEEPLALEDKRSTDIADEYGDNEVQQPEMKKNSPWKNWIQNISNGLSGNEKKSDPISKEGTPGETGKSLTGTDERD